MSGDQYEPIIKSVRALEQDHIVLLRILTFSSKMCLDPHVGTALVNDMNSDPLGVDSSHWIIQKFGQKPTQQSAAFCLLDIFHDMALVNLWSLLDNAPKTLVASMLTYDETLWKLDAVQGVKVEADLALRGDNSEIAEAVCEALWVKIGKKPWLSKVEELMSKVNVKFTLTKKARSLILEFEHVRNLFVHRHGISDHAFKRRMLRKAIDVGKRYERDPFDLLAYMNAVGLAISELSVALRSKYQSDHSDPDPRIKYFRQTVDEFYAEWQKSRDIDDTSDQDQLIDGATRFLPSD